MVKAFTLNQNVHSWQQQIVCLPLMDTNLEGGRWIFFLNLALHVKPSQTGCALLMYRYQSSYDEFRLENMLDVS